MSVGGGGGGGGGGRPGWRPVSPAPTGSAPGWPAGWPRPAGSARRCSTGSRHLHTQCGHLNRGIAGENMYER